MEAFYIVLTNLTRKFFTRSAGTPLLMAALGITLFVVATTHAQTRTNLRQNPQQTSPPMQQQMQQQQMQQQLPPQNRPSDNRDTGNAEAMIKLANDKSTTAQTAAEYAEIIKLCMQARQMPLSQKSANYSNELLGWTYNRRGEMYYARALALAQEGQAAEAKKFDAAALADFENAVAYDVNRWKAFHNRGVCYAASGKSQAAINDFTRVLKLNPDHTDAWYNRAEIRYDRREYDRAAADYTEVIRLKPEDVSAFTGRGHAYFQLGKLREALADYEHTVELSPKDAHALTNRADTEARLGMWEKAAADYKTAVDVDPNLARAYQGAAWLMATCPDEKFRNQKIALQAAKKAIEIGGDDNARFLDTLAAAYANAGQFEEAKALVSRAVQLAPDAEGEPFKVRLASYEQGTPYRLSRVGTAKSNDKRQPVQR